MHKDPRFSGLFLNLDRGSATPPSLWQKIVGGVVMVGVFALALTFSVALFAVVITVGAVAWGYFWWKTRAVRKAMREHMAAEMEARRAAGAAHGGGGAGTRGECGENHQPARPSRAIAIRTLRRFIRAG